MGANVARACVAVQHRISEGGADRRPAEVLFQPQALREARQDLGSALVGATDLFATAENVSLAQDLALLPRYAWQTSLQSPPSVREEAQIGRASCRERV